MATIKSYTDIEQSRRLSKVLAIETSDYYYPVTYIKESTNKYLMCYIKPYIGRLSEIEDSIDTRLYIPCWSLVSLLNILPKIINNETLFIETSPALWHIGYRNIYTARADNPVDACYNMIIELHELKLL